MGELNHTPFKQHYFLRILGSNQKLKLRACVTLHQWPVDRGPLSKSTSYCCPLELLYAKVTETIGNGLFWLSSVRLGLVSRSDSHDINAKTINSLKYNSIILC